MRASAGSAHCSKRVSLPLLRPRDIDSRGAEPSEPHRTPVIAARAAMDEASRRPTFRSRRSPCASDSRRSNGIFSCWPCLPRSTRVSRRSWPTRRVTPRGVVPRLRWRCRSSRSRAGMCCLPSGHCGRTSCWRFIRSAQSPCWRRRCASTSGSLHTSRALNYLDERLAAIVAPLGDPGDLPPSQEAIAVSLAHWFNASDSRGLVQLVGLAIGRESRRRGTCRRDRRTARVRRSLGRPAFVYRRPGHVRASVVTRDAVATNRPPRPRGRRRRATRRRRRQTVCALAVAAHSCADRRPLPA